MKSGSTFSEFESFVQSRIMFYDNCKGIADLAKPLDRGWIGWDETRESAKTVVASSRSAMCGVTPAGGTGQFAVSADSTIQIPMRLAYAGEIAPWIIAT